MENKDLDRLQATVTYLLLILLVLQVYSNLTHNRVYMAATVIEQGTVIDKGELFYIDLPKGEYKATGNEFNITESTVGKVVRKDIQPLTPILQEHLETQGG